MTLQPDKLFRYKLENFQRPASVAAWDRIESGLNKNQSKGIWLKFAAGISVFVVATYLLWPTSPIENQQATNTNPVIPKTEKDEKTTSEKITPTITKENPVSQKAIAKNKSIKKAEPVPTADEENKIKQETPVVIEPTQVQVAAVAETNTIETAPSKTIVYSAEEVNAKFLRKKTPSEATASPEKSSGIQKLMGLAYTLKNPDNGIGDLRQKKDEILALNFLSTKEDKTNKEKN